jgi:hypothetical protein
MPQFVLIQHDIKYVIKGKKGNPQPATTDESLMKVEALKLSL